MKATSHLCIYSYSGQFFCLGWESGESATASGRLDSGLDPPFGIPYFAPMKIPPSLKSGDRIGVIAPARKISEAELKDAMEDLRSWGLIPVYGENLFAIHHQFGGTDEQRASDLQQMIDDPSIRCIFCARGGYGTLRIVDAVSFEGLAKAPKWLVGFSDITTLHNAAYNVGVASVHGPMALSWNGNTSDASSRENLRKVLFGERPVYRYQPRANVPMRPGKGEGRLIGGNLSMLSQLIGTPTDFNTDGAILFLEDLDEYLYHIDRMVVHLKRAGKFDKLAGLVVGGMTDMKDNSTAFGRNAEQIIADAVAEFDYPVCFDFPVGHWPENQPLVHGAMATLKVSHSSVELETKE